jgi:hypothetical protein
MRWFTRDWATGVLSDEEWSRRRQEYADHLNRIGADLRDGAEELVATVNLHDAQVKEWRYAPGTEFVMIVLAGDLQRGYEWLTLRYAGAEMIGASEDDLRGWNLDGAGSEIICDEIDRVSGHYEHRLLIWPRGEFGLRFSALAVESRPASASSDRR